MRRLGVGLVGAGKHGQRYLTHLHTDVPELVLAALCRRDASRGRDDAARLGCRFHADWRALVADPAVEAVIAVVPPILHPALVAAVAAAGKPLLIEKPLAITGAAAVVVRAIRARLPELGALHAVVLNQRFEPSPLGWLDDPSMSGGGILLHTGVHSFDLVRLLTGCEVTEVFCRTARVRTVRTEDNFAAVLRLSGSDTVVTVNGCRATRGRSGMVDVAGDEGQLVGDHQLGFAHLVRGLERTPLPLDEPVPTVREVLRAFARLVLDGERPPATPEDGARAVLIAEACHRSAESGGPVAVSGLDG
ncbi:MAG: Gfo/Idh/MocA family oxidoreductase [Deltaproteobacteria bacterium]|nr:MAG: Gfo/Idh/MocA family oxidoreductase [Deltaproteobacteria bacterium]